MKCIAAFLLVFLPAAAIAQPISLSDCVNKALAHNAALGVSRFEVSAAEQRVAAARSAYLPQIDFNLGYTALDHAPAFRMGNAAVSTQEDAFAASGVSVQQVLYDFGKTKNRVETARQGVVSARAQDAAARANLSAYVAESFYGVLEAEKFLGVADDSIRQLNSHLYTATVLFEQGVITKNDLLQAEVRLAAAKQRRIEAAGLIERRKLELAYLTGISTEELVLADSEDLTEGPLSQCTRPEMLAAESSVKASESLAAEEKARFLPDVVARGSYDFTQNRYLVREVNASVFAGLKWNLFDGFRTTARATEAAIGVERAKLAFRDVRDKLSTEAKSARVDVDVARSKVELARTAIEHAEENLRLNNERYAERVGVASDVMDAQVLLDQAKVNYYQAVYQQKVAVVKLQRALGCAATKGV